jgi:hypothetical protein
MAIFMAKGEHFPPLAHLDPGRALLYKLTPEWIRWGDFTKGESSDETFVTIRPQAS